MPTSPSTDVFGTRGNQNGYVRTDVRPTAAPTATNQPTASGYGGGSNQVNQGVPNLAGATQPAVPPQPGPASGTPSTTTPATYGGMQGGGVPNSLGFNPDGTVGQIWGTPNQTTPPATTNNQPPNPSWTRNADGSYTDGVNQYWQQPDGSWAGTMRAAANNTGTGAAPTNTAPATGTAASGPAATGTSQPLTAAQLMEQIQAGTTPWQWGGSQEIFGANGAAPQDLLRINGATTGASMDASLVQGLIDRYGPVQAQAMIARDMATDSPAARVAAAVRDQQTSANATGAMLNNLDLRNVPQLYQNPITRALLPANIRQAEENRLNGGADWRIASFGDAIQGNNVTRAVSADNFVAPTQAAPQLSQAQQAQNTVGNFMNWLAYRNNPGAQSFTQAFNPTQLNSAISGTPEWMQAQLANRLTGLDPNQLQVALRTSNLTLPQFLSQAVARLAG